MRPEPLTTAIPQPIIEVTQPVISASEECYNEHECCRIWAMHGECDRNKAYMSEWCKPACGRCLPNYNISDGTYFFFLTNLFTFLFEIE